MNTIRRFIRDERGIELSEYVVALGLILVVAFIAITALGGQITRIFNLVVTKLQGVT
jgi:Flp pilus assembly pilin Flp